MDNAEKTKKRGDNRAELDDTKTQAEADRKLSAKTKAACRAKNTHQQEKLEKDVKEEEADEKLTETKRQELATSQAALGKKTAGKAEKTKKCAGS